MASRNDFFRLSEFLARDDASDFDKIFTDKRRFAI
jgi:hypothetical protein